MSTTSSTAKRKYSLRDIGCRKRACIKEEPHFNLHESLSMQVVKHKTKHKNQTYTNESHVSRVKTSQQSSIYLTNYNSANEESTLTKHKIVAVLTLGRDNELHRDVLDVLGCDEAYTIFHVRDERTIDTVAQMKNHVLPEARRFISRWLPFGNVLVHCSRGVCRSPLVVLDYLINADSHSIEKAASAITRRRWCVSPGPTLLSALFAAVGDE